MKRLALPPLELANRVGNVDAAPDSLGYYEELGRRSREDVLSALPDGWSFEGKRVLDFGCGAGRTLRHFTEEAAEAEIWGCDIDAASVDWLRANLCPPLQVFRNEETPPVDQPAGSFDLIWCVSVFTHLVETWSAWLVELRRLLAPGAILIATFQGEGMSQLIAEEPWDEERIGMHVRQWGQGWDLGGPMVLHSPWWIREHWGRAFDILEIRPSGFASEPDAGQGLVVLRKTAEEVDGAELERIDGREPREVRGLVHGLHSAREEIAEWRHTAQWLEGELARCRAGQERLEQAHASIIGSASWRLTAPLRAAKQRLARRRG
jgi:SAM-dependent methyltransferase